MGFSSLHRATMYGIRAKNSENFADFLMGNDLVFDRIMSLHASAQPQVDCNFANVQCPGWCGGCNYIYMYHAKRLTTQNKLLRRILNNTCSTCTCITEYTDRWCMEASRHQTCMVMMSSYHTEHQALTACTCTQTVSNTWHLLTWCGVSPRSCHWSTRRGYPSCPWINDTEIELPSFWWTCQEVNEV